MGNIILFLEYLLKKNKDVSVQNIIPKFAFNQSYLINTSNNEKYFLYGPIKKDNLENFNEGIKYLTVIIKSL